jgi:hypothetical protein
MVGDHFARFEGADYIEVPDEAFRNVKDEITVSFWLVLCRLTRDIRLSFPILLGYSFSSTPLYAFYGINHENSHH